jgi:nucleoside-diphosphate-sugar epimerase
VRRALVTGAGGALGRALVARLSAAPDWQVVATGRSPTTPGLEQLDVTCHESVVRAIAATLPDVIFHLAANFSKDFDEAYIGNVCGTRTLLSALAATGSAARLLLIGSAAEYGLVRPEDNPITEGQVLRPMTVYGITKAWQTQLGVLYASHGANVVVARLFNLRAVGLSDRLFVGRVERQIAEVLAGGRATIEVGSLEAVRDYVPVADAVEQILAIAVCGRAGNVYHVGSGSPIRMRDLLSAMLAEHSLGMELVKENNPSSSHQGYDVPIAYADMTETRHLMEQCGHHANN